MTVNMMIPCSSQFLPLRVLRALVGINWPPLPGPPITTCAPLIYGTRCPIPIQIYVGKQAAWEKTDNERLVILVFIYLKLKLTVVGSILHYLYRLFLCFHLLKIKTAFQGLTNICIPLFNLVLLGKTYAGKTELYWEVPPMVRNFPWCTSDLTLELSLYRWLYASPLAGLLLITTTKMVFSYNYL